MREMWFPSLGCEDPPGEGMATHSSILAWKLPQRNLVGYSPWDHRIGHDWSNLARMNEKTDEVVCILYVPLGHLRTAANRWNHSAAVPSHGSPSFCMSYPQGLNAPRWLDSAFGPLRRCAFCCKSWAPCDLWQQGALMWRFWLWVRRYQWSSSLGISPCARDRLCGSMKWSRTVSGVHQTGTVSCRYTIENMALSLSLQSS